MAQPKIPDYYFDLGLKQNATKREITVAFRRLSLQFHPDKNPGKEAEFKPKFIKVSTAICPGDHGNPNEMEAFFWAASNKMPG